MRHPIRGCLPVYPPAEKVPSRDSEHKPDRGQDSVKRRGQEQVAQPHDPQHGVDEQLHAELLHPAKGGIHAFGMVPLAPVPRAVPAKHALFILDCCCGGLAVKRGAPPVVAGLSSATPGVVSWGW